MGNRSKASKYKFLYGPQNVHIYDPKTEDSVCLIFQRGVGNPESYSISSSPPGKTICKSCLETMTRLTKRSKARKKPLAPSGSRYDTNKGRVNGFWRPDMQDIDQKVRCQECSNWFKRKLGEEWKLDCYSCYLRKNPSKRRESDEERKIRLELDKRI